EVEEALKSGVDRIMLDNMDTQTMKKAVKLISGKCESEASGGITRDMLKEVASTGVDYISAGALTHSADNIDLSLKAVTNEG
ncbi:MAG: nicotinate-nucleotide diphosphorylase, partial [Kaistella sp.]